MDDTPSWAARTIRHSLWRQTASNSRLKSSIYHPLLAYKKVLPTNADSVGQPHDGGGRRRGTKKHLTTFARQTYTKGHSQAKCSQAHLCQEGEAAWHISGSKTW
jgi:hypothetical protein